MPTSITLLIIARDEERCIRRCITSICKYVDDVVVVDTGSLDNTAAIAKSCGAVVQAFRWIDDFAAARNYGLSKVKTPWVVTLDADEWMIEGGNTLTSVVTSPPSSVFEVCMHMRPYDSEPSSAPSVVGTFFTPRVFPSNLRYKGRIHESLVHQLPISRLNLLLGHDGYEPEQRKRKTDRNTKLLMQSLEEDAANPFLNYYYAKDLRLQLESAGAEIDSGHLSEVRRHFKLALDNLAISSPAWELFAREYLLFLRDYCQFADGINLIFQALSKESLSLELSYTAAIFLYEAAIKQNDIPRALLIENGDAFFMRVRRATDKQSQYYPYEINLQLLVQLRDTAKSRS